MASKNKAKEQKITREMTIGDVVAMYPDVAPILMENGIHCFGCGANAYETVEQGFAGHGLTDEEIDKLVGQMNEVAEREGPAQDQEHGHAGCGCGHGHGHEEQHEELVPLDSKELANGKIISLTAKAAGKLADILKEQGKADYGIKVAVLPGGCAGYTYSMEIVKGKEQDDVVQDEGPVKLFIEAASAPHLKGCQIDYLETLQASGFKFSNPNAKASCGCGKSFA
ncbi:MAG: iron-sulfur cluster assembly accessory protein [Candidatus Aenigmarchaeota archaeon]|nr:iron-sulfur cluster assembly accessory protein [Candidatus Aenigmarchaeota archaeon]